MAKIVLDFNAYKHNLEYLATFTGDISAIMIVLKDNAYGHGLVEIAPLAAACGIKRAVVKNSHEALKICDFFEQTLVLIEPNPENIVQNDKIAYTISDLNAITLFPKNSLVHLKIDTGMRRNGIYIKELNETFELIAKQELNLTGVYTHFYGADVLGSDFFVQEQTFKKAKEICKKLANKYGFDLVFHSKNSSALLRGTFDDDYARIGIASYGYTDLHESFGRFDLRPILSLWADKISTRKVLKGDRVGYTGSYKVAQDMIISTYDVGYGDGLFRYDGKGILKVKNNQHILGKMSMDSLSLQGDAKSICIFDDANHMANFFNTITYEILTKLSPHLTRVVLH